MGAEVRLVDEGFNIGIRRNWEKSALGCQGKWRQTLYGTSRRRLCPQIRWPWLCGVLPRSACSGEAALHCTGSTHCGMIIGFADDGRQHTCSVSMPLPVPQKTRAQVRRIAQHTAGLVEIGVATVIEARD